MSAPASPRVVILDCEGFPIVDDAYVGWGAEGPGARRRRGFVLSVEPDVVRVEDVDGRSRRFRPVELRVMVATDAIRARRLRQRSLIQATNARLGRKSGARLTADRALCGAGCGRARGHVGECRP